MPPLVSLSPCSSKKTGVALIVLLIVLIIIGYTYSPKAADPVVKNLKESKVCLLCVALCSLC